MTQKTWTAAILLICLSLLVFGCAGGGTGSNEAGATNEAAPEAGAANTDAPSTGAGAQAGLQAEGDMTYWYPWGGESEEWDKGRIADYMAEKPGVNINAVYVPPDGGLSNGKLIAAISGKNPPDLVISNEFATAYSLSTQNALMPLDDLMAKAGFSEDEIIDSFKPLMKYKDQTYIFPQDSNVKMLFYNVEMFREAGLDPDHPPKTIAELDAAAEKLNKINGDNIERLGFIPWLDSGDEAFLWGWVYGADFYDPETGKVKLDDERLAQVYDWMNGYAKRFNPEKIKSFSSGFGGQFSPDHPFFTGKVAMTVNGNWFANLLKTYAPDIEYRVAPIPYPEGGREKATTFGTNVFMIPKGAKNPEAAMDFILSAGKPEQLADNINIWRSISVYKEPSDAIKWDSEGDEVYKVVREIAESPNSGHPALTSVAKEMSNELNLLRDNVIYNDKDPRPLLKELEKKLQAAADKKK